MRLICKRCNHRWKTRTDNAPTICPKCKSTRWKKYLSSAEVTELLNDRCHKIIEMSPHVDYCTMAPTLLLAVMVAFSEAEKTATDGDRSVEKVSAALDHLNIIQQLVVEKVIPKELCRICIRLGESYFRDTISDKGGHLT